MLRQQLPGAGLVIVGSGSLQSELQNRISSSHERDHVLLCGDVPHPLTVRLIAASDLFLRTTLYDGDSVSVREALQLGVPVVATDNGMRPAGVHLIPRSDPEALRHAITTVISVRSARVSPPPRADDGVESVFELYAALLRNQVLPFAEQPRSEDATKSGAAGGACRDVMVARRFRNGLHIDQGPPPALDVADQLARALRGTRHQTDARRVFATGCSKVSGQGHPRVSAGLSTKSLEAEPRRSEVQPRYRSATRRAAPATRSFGFHTSCHS